MRDRQVIDGNSTEIFDGAIGGAALSWKILITDPMPLTLTFSGSVKGDQLNGSVVLGEFGNSAFSGTRGQASGS